MQGGAQDEFLRAAQMLGMGFVIEGYDAQRSLESGAVQGVQRNGIEGFERQRAGIAGDIGQSLPAQRPRLVGIALLLDLDHQRHLAGHPRQQFGKPQGRVAIGAVRQGDGAQRFGRGVPHQPILTREAGKLAIVENHGLAIGCQLQVAFDAEAARNGRLERRARIFDDAAGAVMQAAMRHRRRKHGIVHIVFPA